MSKIRFPAHLFESPSRQLIRLLHPKLIVPIFSNSTIVSNSNCAALDLLRSRRLGLLYRIIYVRGTSRMYRLGTRRCWRNATVDQWRIVHWKWQDCTQVIFFPPNIFVPMNASRRAKPYMYCQPFARTNSFFYSFVPHTISAWNALPGYVTDKKWSFWVPWNYEVKFQPCI